MSSIKESYPELFSGTPLADDLIKAGWPHFTFAEKAEILAFDPGRYRHSQQGIKELALRDENPLIRRLASQHLSAPRDYDQMLEASKDGELWAKVQQDPDIRVREPWSGMGSFWGIGKHVAWFWSQPQYTRLCTVHGSSDAKWVASAFEYAIENNLFESGPNEVTNADALDIILQFLRWPGDGVSDRNWKGLEDLWKAATHPKMPPRLRSVLLYELDWIGSFPTELQEQLTEEEILGLLERENFDPYMFRRTIFDTGSTKLRATALHSPKFRLQDDELASYFPIPTDTQEERRAKLSTLAILCDHYQGGSLPQFQALLVAEEDYRKERHDLPETKDLPYSTDLTSRITKRVKAMTYYELRKESARARWMVLAELVSRSQNPHGFPEEFPRRFGGGQWTEFVVSGNLWATYKNLAGYTWADKEWLVDHLPSLDSLCMEFEAVPVLLRGIEDQGRDESSFDLLRHAYRRMKDIPEETKPLLEVASVAFWGLQQSLRKSQDGILSINATQTGFAGVVRSIAIGLLLAGGGWAIWSVIKSVFLWLTRS